MTTLRLYLSACTSMTKHFLGIWKAFIFPLQIGNSRQTKVQITPKSNLVNQWILLGLTVGEELLTGSEMTQLSHQGSPQRGWQLVNTGKWKKTGKPVAHCIAYRHLNMLESVFLGATMWVLGNRSKSFATATSALDLWSDPPSLFS